MEIKADEKIIPSIEFYEKLSIKEAVKATKKAFPEFPVIKASDEPLELPNGVVPNPYLELEKVSLWVNKDGRKVIRKKVRTLLGTHEKYIVIHDEGPVRDHSQYRPAYVGERVNDSAPYIDKEKGWKKVTGKEFYGVKG